MKRTIVLALVFAFLMSTFVFAAPTAQSGSVSLFESQLHGAVKSVLSEEKVLHTYQTAVLSSQFCRVHSALGVPRATGKEQTTLLPGDTVTVLDDTSVLTFYTVAVIEREEAAAEGEEPTVTTEERRFETKTVYLSRGTRFVFTLTADGADLHLISGSLTYTFRHDTFDMGQMRLSTRDAVFALGEQYCVLGTDQNGSTFYSFGGQKVRVTTHDAKRTVAKGEGVFIENGVLSENRPFSATPAASDAAFYHIESLFFAMTKNSAVAEGVASLFDASENINTVREKYLFAYEEQRRKQTLSFEKDTTEDALFSCTADGVSLGDLSPKQEEAKDTVWSVVYPASCGAYTVSDALTRVNLSKLKSEDHLTVKVFLQLPLKQEDSLALTLGDLTFDIALTEGLSTYVFTPNVGEIKALFAEDASEKQFSVRYETSETYLFVEEGGQVCDVLQDETLPLCEAGKATSVAIRLKQPLAEGDTLFLLHTAPDGTQVEIAPTAIPEKEGEYLFTLTPKEGVNYAEVVFCALHRLTVENALGEDFFAQLVDTAGTGFVVSGSTPSLIVGACRESEYVPVVLQKTGEQTVALSADAKGRYRLSEVLSDTTLVLTLGYPVELPKDTDLYTVTPVHGYAADYAECGGEWRFKVSLSGDAALGTSLLVKNNGVSLTPNSDGVYIIAEVTQPVRISVTHGVTYNVFLPMGEGYTTSPYGGDGTTVLENGTFRFTLTLAKDVKVDQLIVAANESVLLPDSMGVYTVSGIQRDVYITVRLVSALRVVLPEGEGYTVEPYGESKTTVATGGTFAFTVKTDESVRDGSKLSVFANGILLKSEKGVYTVSDIREDVFITVRLVRSFAVRVPSETDEFKVIAPADYVLYGEAFSFSVTQKGSRSLVVRVNGEKVSPVGGTYTIDAVYTDLYITVEPLGDAAKPVFRVTLVGDSSVGLVALGSTEVTSGDAFYFKVTVPTGRDISIDTEGLTYTMELLTEAGDPCYLVCVKPVTKEVVVTVRATTDSASLGE